MIYAWCTISLLASGSLGFYGGARFVNANLHKILAKMSNAQLAALADEVARERERGNAV